ncbi:uncharacterized protein [Chelonus insularis]|uniref:uncharacterized protein n=1 Tax=Chelonus insularis TaxID=460826 RepID=UPI00158F2A3D|nr:uncharacterized protein LOC118067269 [Chelonus insularis]
MWSQVKDKREILAQKNTKMRFIPRSKWALPMKTSNYWRKILEDIESKTLKVREPSLTPFSLVIPASFSKRKIKNVDDSHHDLKIKPTISEPLVRISPPSPTHNCSKYLNAQIEVSNALNVEGMNNLVSCDSRKSQNNIKSEMQIESENEIINKQSSEDIHFNHPYPSLFKISQLSKISKCINNFLAHTRDTVKSGAECEIFKNTVSPEQTLDSDMEKMKKFFAPKNTFNKTDIQCEPQESSKVINVDREKEIKECSTVRLEQKKVSFLNVENDKIDSISETEYRPVPRRRAPSIAIASALPSFGKNVSSLEYSDSLDNSLFNEDFSTEADTPETVENTDQVMKAEASREPDKSSTKNNNLQVLHYQKVDHYSPRYSRNQQKMRSKYLFAKSSKPKEFQSIEKFQYWPKKSLVNILKALKVMKSSTRKTINGRRNEHLFLTTSPLQRTSAVEGSFNSTITHKFTDHSSSIRSEECYEKESTSTSPSSLCSYSSVRRRPIEKPSVSIEKKILSSPGFADNLKIESDTLSRRISSELDISVVSTSNQADTSSIFKKDKSILKKIPQVDRMYQRKKSDKCLACLHTSMMPDSTNFLRFDNVKFSISSMSEGKLILDEPDNISYSRTDYNSRHELFRRETTLDLEQSDIEFELLEDNLITEKVRSSTELNNASNNLADQFRSNVSSSLHAVDRKSDAGYERKSIISSKSLISNLSVVSDRSKTASDQDDSDQAIDEGGEMEQNIVESRSKFLAPCHAPLNLRPSLEPLKALRNKQARSIQSRMASLEKSTEAESDEKSEDDEVPIVVTKGKDNNEKKYISTRIESDRLTTFTSESTKESRQNLNCIIIEESLLNLDDFNDLLAQIKHQSDLREQCKANELLIADKIFSELNMTKKRMEYNWNNSFVPIFPILFDYEIVEISQKLLKEGKSIVEILHELVKIYSDRLSERALHQRKKMDPDVSKNIEMIKRLLMLLVDSKTYLNHQQNSSNPSLPPSQKPSINSRQLRRVFPVKSYNLIAPILGLPEWHPKRWTSVRDANKLRVGSKKVITTDDRFSLKLTGQDSDTSIDLIAHPPTQEKTASTEDEGESWTKKRLNPYGFFITKPRRKVVIWRPLVAQDFEGYDPETTLKRRAARITNEICTDFCQWLRSLGGFDTTIDEEVLKEMFETDFSADACRAMQISLKELPMVPSSIAKALNCPDAGEFQRVRKQLMLDVKAENQQPRLTAFGSALPNDLKYIPPKNEVNLNWLHCENIPEDLETMDAVWKNITDLDSVKGFINWIQIHHPKTKLPAALKHSSVAKKSNLNPNKRIIRYRKCLAKDN